MTQEQDAQVAKAVGGTAKRVRHLETLEYIARAGVADLADVATTALAITDGLILLDLVVDAVNGTQTIAAGAGVWEADAGISQTITVPVGKTATIVAAYQARWINRTAVRNNSTSFRGLLDAANGQESGYYASLAIDANMHASVINHWTGIAAGNHTIGLQFRRFNGGDTVVVSRRVMWALAIEE